MVRIRDGTAAAFALPFRYIYKNTSHKREREMPETALDRFLRYVRIETTSKDGVERVPSTPGQLEFGALLANELRAMGAEDVFQDEHGYVTATIPDRRPAAERAARPIPVMGWIAHLDTAPDTSGKNVNPKLIDYKGGPIRLESGAEIPESEGLHSCIGDLLVVTDGTTLLGADDKSGVAAIMTAADRLLNGGVEGVPYPHGKIRIAFTPDEEVGRGADFFDVKKFGADFAYTVDGELPGEINKETFSAEQLRLAVTGVDIHPGTAKGVMVNASRALAGFAAELPADRAPESTEGRQPYIHLCSMTGDVASAEAHIILRAFTDAEMDENRQILDELIERRKEATPGSVWSAEYKKQYPNMAEGLKGHPEILTRLEEAVRRAGAEPVWKPIRGGTDGSRLTEMGLPTPNLFTGGNNFHAVTEWLSVNKMEIAVQTLLNLASLVADL